MITFGGLGGGGGTAKPSEKLPRDVKEAVSNCRAAVQEALQKQVSRMEIEMPVGTKFGVEKSPKRSKSNDGGAPTKNTLDQSDRELARLFVEMFQPVGGQNICVIFNEQSLAEMAKKKWSDAPSRILALNRRKSIGGKNKKANKPRGFAAKLAAEVDDVDDDSQPSGPFQLPKGTEVALFVAPGPKELAVIKRICDEVGMGTLVILLNARLSKVSNFGTSEATELFTKEFEPVFCLTAAPQTVAPDCLLYRAYPNQWITARKPKVGQPKPLFVQSNRPTEEDCRKAYDALEISDMERGVEDALENVAGWFR